MSKISSPFARAMQILETVAASGGGLSLHELARRTGLPTSTAYRMAKGLVASGHLCREEQSGTFTAGSRLRRLGQYLLGRGSIEAITGPVLHDLCERLEEAVFMTRFNSHEIEVVSEALPQGNYRAHVSPGRVFPIHATASGKMLYAMQQPHIIDEALRGVLQKYSPRTTTDPHEIRAHLKTVRAQGYAISDEELDPGVFSLACPVLIAGMEPIYAVCIVGVREGLLVRNAAEDLVGQIKKGAAALSIVLSPYSANPDAAGGGDLASRSPV